MLSQNARLAMIGLALASAISVAADGSSKKSGGKPLHCHLIAERKSDPADGVFPGVLELRNDSKEPIVIEYRDDPTDHLALDVRDPHGKLLPKTIPYYGGVYAKITIGEQERDTLTIKPGETYRQNLALFETTDRETHPLAPGKYTIEAVYKWGGKELRSDKVSVEVRAN